MELRNVLNQLKSASGAGMAKTASTEARIPKTAAAESELLDVLNQAVGAVEKDPSTRDRGEKTASATEELTKMATTLANADHEVMRKEAELFGAAVMDGFVARGAQYGVPLVGEKTASAVPAQEDFQKWAQENPAEYKQYFAQGFQETAEHLKQAEAAEFEKWATTPEGQEAVSAYNEGYKKASAEIEKLASTPEGQEKLASFRQGYVDTMQQLETIASGDGGQEKIAAIKQGFEEGNAQIQKLAADYYNRGYHDTATLLRNMG